MSSRRNTPAKPLSRRNLLKASLSLGVSATSLGALGSRAFAQSDQAWWQAIIGRGSQLDAAPRGAEELRQRRREELQDLREGPTPWLSDVMLENMQIAIGRYEKLVARGNWPEVPGPRMMRPGDDDERVPVLRARLRASGELGPPRYSYEGFNFDGALEQAVRRFQARHGLRVRGRVDRPTFAALNISPSMRLQQLKLNYRRIQDDMRDRIPDRYVLVNVPAFQLEAVEQYEVQRRHRVIAGRQGRETPSIKATIQGLNFFPHWRVPDSVARSDLIPRLKKDPTYIEQEHITVSGNGSYDGPPLDPRTIDWYNADLSQLKFKQQPGEWNALGLVRIDMPNEHIVYMHDTPMKNLFDRPSRGFSAGCVRVQDVMDLVDWIAQYELGWEQPGRAAQVIEAGQPLDLMLNRPIPVYFTYITAWAESDGTVQFRPDIYDRDGSRAYAGDIDPDAPPPPITLTP